VNQCIVRSAVALLTLLLLVGGSVQLAAAQESADLALTKVADRTQVRIGETITFTITLTNLGPASATGVVFGDPVPDPLNLVSFTCSQGTISGQSFCAVDSLPSGASVTAILVATPITNPAKSERRFSNTAFIAESATPDPNSSNNSASLKLHIIGKSP
jgi:uncharacterized repeat protein (TIGR01451 family)